jgi:plasmid stabilization system protein ParE
VSLRVRFTPAARAQFLAALDYIRTDNPSAALALRQKAEESLSRLADFPESGRSVPEFPDLPFREVIVARYRFFYRVKADTVWVVAVWHGAQLPGEPDDVGRAPTSSSS